MKTYILDIIPKIKKFSQKLDDITLLTNQHWVVMDSIGKTKTIFIFRHNNELLISTNGKVKKGKWEYLGNQSLLIDLLDESYLYKHGFFDKNVLALKSDNKNEYAVLINENKFDGELNSLVKLNEFLEDNYLKEPVIIIDKEYFPEDSDSDGLNIIIISSFVILVLCFLYFLGVIQF